MVIIYIYMTPGAVRSVASKTNLSVDHSVRKGVEILWKKSATSRLERWYDGADPHGVLHN